MDAVLLLTSLTTFTLLAGICSIVFNKAKLPPLIGYLVAGIIIANLWEGGGPDSDAIVSLLSDMGLVMLMFCIGLEINLKKIRKTGILAVKVVVVEIPMMVIAGILVGSLIGFTTIQCIVLGAIIAGSSTAVVVAVMKSHGNLDKDHMELIVLLMVMEDIAQVLMLSIITPLMAGSSMDTNAVLVMIISIIVFMGVSVSVGMKVIPRVVNWVSDNVSSEVLVVFSVGLAFGMALMSVQVGLSMAIGAFLMGMMIGTSRKSKEINRDIDPMKNLFMAMFFISVGMEVGVDALVDSLGLVLVLVTTYILFKLVSVFAGFWIGNEDARTGFLSAASMLTMGEFAFIIAKEALDFGVFDESFYTAVIGAALITMILLPVINRYTCRMWDLADRRFPDRLRLRLRKVNEYRDNFYRRVHATSRRSQKILARSMTHAYINVLVIVAVEIAFYTAMPYATGWLVGSFGGPRIVWTMLLLVANFLALALPTYHLVINTKYLDELVIAGAKMVTNREGMTDEPGHIYQRYLNINTYLVVATIDSVILFLVPNQLEPLQHLAVFFIAGLIIAVMILRANKENDALRDDSLGEPDDRLAVEIRIPENGPVFDGGGGSEEDMEILLSGPRGGRL